MLDITGLDRVSVFMALYEHAKPQGMGFIHYQPGPLTREEAETWMKIADENCSSSYDYVKGRVMKFKLPPDATSINPSLYDRDNGEGAAQRAIDKLRNG